MKDSKSLMNHICGKVKTKSHKFKQNSSMLNFLVKNQNSSFVLQIQRNSSGTLLWDTSIGGFTFDNQFLQLATKLPSELLYGFGENLHQSLVHDFSKFKIWPLFTRDVGPNVPKRNIYEFIRGPSVLHFIGTG